MKRVLPFLLLGVLCSAYAVAQRDAPVWESYLASTTITHGPDSTLDLELSFKKEGGPYEHTEHQMYLIGYLKKDEQEVLKLTSDKALLDKTKAKAKMFLDVLTERKLAVVFDTQVRKRSFFAAQDTSGKYRDGSKANRGKAGLKLNTFPFEFSVKNQTAFAEIAGLQNFDSENVEKIRHQYFNDTFKFLIFVPVNDCKYATQVSAEIRSKHDFANYKPETEGEGELFYRKTPVLYCRPLPYEFRLMRTTGGDIRIYIN